MTRIPLYLRYQVALRHTQNITAFTDCWHFKYGTGANRGCFFFYEYTGSLTKVGVIEVLFLSRTVPPQYAKFKMVGEVKECWKVLIIVCVVTYGLNPWRRAPVEKFGKPWNATRFMELECAVLCSQNPVIANSSGPDESSSHPLYFLGSRHNPRIYT